MAKNLFSFMCTLIWVVYWWKSLNGPFSLKRADSGCPWPYDPRAAQIGLFLAKWPVKVLALLAINIQPKLMYSSVAVFPFLHFLTSLPLQFCFNSDYVWISGNLYVFLTKFRVFFIQMASDSLKYSYSNMRLTFIKFFGAGFIFNAKR